MHNDEVSKDPSKKVLFSENWELNKDSEPGKRHNSLPKNSKTPKRTPKHQQLDSPSITKDTKVTARLPGLLVQDENSEKTIKLRILLEERITNKNHKIHA